jgi:cell division protein FtsN
VLDFRRSRPEDRRYGVQIGAFATVQEAEDFARAHAAALAHEPIYLLPAEIPGRGTWVRVRVGASRSKDAAEVILRGLPADLSHGALVVSYR